MTANDIREMKTAINGLAVVVAKLSMAVDSNKEHNKETIKELRELTKETKKEFCDKYEKHSGAITEHGKEIAKIQESIKAVKSNYKSITAILTLVLTFIFNLIVGAFKS